LKECINYIFNKKKIFNFSKWIEEKHLKRGILLGTALSSSTIGVLFESFTLPRMKKSSVFSGTDEEILAEFADIIIQLQNSPGAKAAGVASFISIMIKDCYPAAMQHAFLQA
jgi:hypothetical protein